MKYLILFCLVFCVSEVYMMSEKQMKSAANMVRNVCQPKTKVTNEQIDNMHKGEFEDDSKPKCYMKCVYETLRIMKSGQILHDSAMKQINALPPDYVEPVTAIYEKCKTEVKSSDPCEAGYELAKCWYFTDAKYYFFP